MLGIQSKLYIFPNKITGFNLKCCGKKNTIDTLSIYIDETVVKQSS